MTQRTENEMLELLRRRHTETRGNGEAWAFIPHVRDAASWDGRRTCDAIAMASWKSRGYLIHGFEIKTSRSDWLRELRKPEKMEAFFELIDRWWLVAADDSIVQPGELPETWGLLVVKGGRLVGVKEAPKLRDRSTASPADEPLPPGFSRSFLATLLRSACRVSGLPKSEVVAAREEGFRAGREQARMQLERAERSLDELRDRVRSFEGALGGRNLSFLERDELKRVGAIVRAALDGELATDQLEQRLDHLLDEARAIVAAIERQREHQVETELQKVADAA